jgi:hypothetical protein
VKEGKYYGESRKVKCGRDRSGSSRLQDGSETTECADQPRSRELGN